MQRRWFVLGLLFCLLPSLGLGQVVKTAKVCIDNYPPFSYFDQGQPRGAMLDALVLIGQEVGFQPVATPNTPFARCLRMAEAGLVDFMVSLMPTSERLQYMVMFPYAEPESLRLISRVDLTDEPRTQSQILGFRLGLINGYQYPAHLSEHPLTLLAPTPEAGFRLLDSRRIDLLILNQSVATHLVDQQPERYKLLQAQLYREENVNSIGLSRKSWLYPKSDKVGAAIDTLRAQGTFDQLIEQHQQRQSPTGND